MDIDYLKEFLLLSKTLNYRVAAESLFITQSTLSKHIKALEKDLGAELFNRSTVNVSLSENGFTFLEYAKRIVREYDMAQETLSGIHHIHGTLRVGGAIRYPVINTLISTTLALFEAKYPDVSVIAEDIQWQDFRRSLLNGKYDIIFGARFPTFNAEGIIYCDICEVPLCAWVNKNQRLAKENTASLEDLSGLSLRILDPFKSEAFSSYLRELFAAKNLSVKVGKPLTLLYALDEDEFAMTPAFAPGDFFGHDLRAVVIGDVGSVPISCFKPRHVSNPIISLFYDEFMAMRKELPESAMEAFLQDAPWGESGVQA